MMSPKIWSSTHASDNYARQLVHLIDSGDKVDVRGRQTLEILNAITVVEEPWHHCILLPERRWNPWLAMSEFLWIMAGRNDIGALLPYNRNIVEFSDDGMTTYGAYGRRIFDQIDDLVERLRKDPSDRRAVLQIWDTHRWHDLTQATKDPPCNNLIYFKLREGQLHMTVMCRSNDIHWGLYAVNLPTFSMLQVYLAARLAVDVGTQTHLSNSLHVYLDDTRAQAITERMLYGKEEGKPVYPSHELIFRHREMDRTPDHASFASACSAVLDQEIHHKSTYPLFLAFANQFLKCYRERDLKALNSLGEVYPEFRDWVMAGQLFAVRVWKQDVSQPAST